MILPVLQAFIKQKCLSDILPTESPGLNDAEAPCIYTGPLQGRSPVYVFEEWGMELADRSDMLSQYSGKHNDVSWLLHPWLFTMKY